MKETYKAVDYILKLKALSPTRDDIDINIEELDGKYILYKNYSRRKLTTYLGYYKATIFQENNETVIQIRMRKEIVVSIYLFYLFSFSLIVFLISREERESIMFIVPMLLLGIYYRRSRTRFRKFIIRFLDNL